MTRRSPKYRASRKEESTPKKEITPLWPATHLKIEFCILTDLEPDDLQALMLLCKVFPDVMMSALYIVGVAQVDKVELCNIILTGLLRPDDTGYKFNIVQSHPGSSKTIFPMACLNVYRVAEKKVANTAFDDGVAALNGFLKNCDSKGNTLFLLKPWPELVACVDALYDTNNIEVLGYGSFNKKQTTDAVAEPARNAELDRWFDIHPKRGQIYERGGFVEPKELRRSKIIDLNNPSDNENRIKTYFGDALMQKFTIEYAKDKFCEKCRPPKDDKWMSICPDMVDDKFLQSPIADHLPVLAKIFGRAVLDDPQSPTQRYERVIALIDQIMTGRIKL